MSTRPRVVFAQYVNPGMYPPIQNASMILAESGWDVLIVGIGAPGTAGTLTVPSHPRIRTVGWRYCPPGVWQKFHYLVFCLACVWHTVWFRANWVYLSDPMSTLLGWVFLTLRYRVVYHEHDGPSVSQIERRPLWIRKRTTVARRADLCVLPAAGRIARFVALTGRTGPTICVNNCPLRRDLRPARTGSGSGRIQLLYSGSIGPDRIPESIIRALTLLPVTVTFRAVGYEISERDIYIPKLKQLAAELGVADRVEFLPGRSRHKLWDLLAESDVGLSLRPMTVTDPNFEYMVGATNKAFDYFAVGMPLLVSALPEWVEGYVRPGLAKACLPDDAGSVAAALLWYHEHPDEMRAMGERGRRRVESEWNYETQFAPVLSAMTEALPERLRSHVEPSPTASPMIASGPAT
jgi:glycosyltransferase involved in cell wall biosynthesis